jgi:hypothetical protein
MSDTVFFENYIDLDCHFYKIIKFLRIFKNDLVYIQTHNMIIFLKKL